jgi:cytidylate kinase
MAVITISRQYGSGGDEIASRVCEMLSYRYFDKRLMAQVASEMGLSADEIVDFSEENYKARGFLERLFSRRGARVVAEAGTWTQDTTGARTVQVEQLDEEWCVRMVKSAIQAAYRQGDVVIAGRGGQVILQDKPGVLHVRIEAPLDARVNRVRYREPGGLTPDLEQRAAQEKVNERDRAAAAYLRRFYDVNWADSRLYHLVIDTQKWGIERAACLMTSAVRCLSSAS